MDKMGLSSLTGAEFSEEPDPAYSLLDPIEESLFMAKVAL